jgi:hypothetical protein
MKYLIVLLLFTGCTTITAQDDKAAAEEREFNDLVKKTSNNLDLSLSTQAKASEKQTKIVNETVAKITTLKAEVKTLKEENNVLKEENNVFKVKLDSNTAVGKPFKLLPVSDGKDNR